jgi:hypothetical protein
VPCSRTSFIPQRAARKSFLHRASLRAQAWPREAPPGIQPQRQTDSPTLTTTHSKTGAIKRTPPSTTASTPAQPQPPGARGAGSERALEANTLYSPARSAKAFPPQSLPASAGPTPRSPTRHTAPSPDRQTPPQQHTTKPPTKLTQLPGTIRLNRSRPLRLQKPPNPEN